MTKTINNDNNKINVKPIETKKDNAVSNGVLHTAVSRFWETTRDRRDV